MEKGIKKKFAQGEEEEDMSISICDCSDSIHEEICLHFECHSSTLNNLQHTHKSPNIICMDTSFGAAAFSGVNIQRWL